MERALAVLRQGGLDIVAPFARSWADGAPPSGIPILDEPDPLCLLVGNSRALWPVFLDAHRRGHTQPEHPLDRWCEWWIRAAAARFAEHTAVCLSFDPDPVPLQHVAHRVGVAHLSPSHLCVHPTFGPWFGLRGVIVVDRPGPVGIPPIAPDPCTPCAKPCLDALSEAMAGRERPERHVVRADWQRWAAVRRVCPVGAEHAYDADQERYHYTHDPAVLG